MTITVRPDSFIRRRAASKSRSPWSSKLELGSSKITSFGWPYIARARPTRCLWPADSAPAFELSTVS